MDHDSQILSAGTLTAVISEYCADSCLGINRYAEKSGLLRVQFGSWLVHRFGIRQMFSDFPHGSSGTCRRESQNFKNCQSRTTKQPATAERDGLTNLVVTLA